MEHKALTLASGSDSVFFINNSCCSHHAVSPMTTPNELLSEISWV